MFIAVLLIGFTLFWLVFYHLNRLTQDALVTVLITCNAVLLFRLRAYKRRLKQQERVGS